jgi:quercetin dioxygenase-like cupin family protein
MTSPSTSPGSQSEVWPGRAQRVAGPSLSVDLPFACALLRAEPAYAQDGHTARTLAKYRDLRVLLVAMRPDARMAVHETAERLALQVLMGRVRLWLRGGGSEDAGEGTFVALDSERAEAIECLDECAFTLTVAWPPDHSFDDDGPVEM